MAVSTKSLVTKDVFSKTPKSTVHYIKVTKANKKGASEAIGGILSQSLVKDDFYITLPTTVNGKPVKIRVRAGQIVFRVNDNKRWQVANPEELKKRFPNAKF
jgi:hypothetical protein